MTLPKNYIERLESEQIFELAEFVVSENFKYHMGGVYPEDYENNIDSIFKEEVLYYRNARIFVSRDLNNSIVGSIRVLRWNYKDVLPIYKLFGIDPLLLNDNKINKPIWHVGRFAIKKGVRDVNLFKKLMVCAIAPICRDKNSIAYAECDSKLLKVMQALGIKAIPIDEPINYLGSETIPICIPYNGLIDFFKGNKSLVPMDFLVSTVNLGLLKRVIPPYANTTTL